MKITMILLVLCYLLISLPLALLLNIFKTPFLFNYGLVIACFGVKNYLAEEDYLS